MAVVKLVGVTFSNEDGTSRQKILERIYDDLWTEGREDEIVLELRAEVGNPHDENAVAVHVVAPAGFEGQIGYVPKDDAPLVRRALGRGIVGRVRFREMMTGRGGRVAASLGIARKAEAQA
jgi:hypothetical protein